MTTSPNSTNTTSPSSTLSEPPVANPFRSSTNQRLLKGLFYEQTLADKSSVVYTLKDKDHEGYPSLYRLYMETNDPTEWKFANKYLDGWEHWEMLLACTWFKPYADRWRKELELRMKSESLARIMTEAKTASKESFQANRYLLEKGWEPKASSTHGRGRPSKDEVAKAAKEIAQTNSRVLEDFQRLNISSAKFGTNA